MEARDNGPWGHAVRLIKPRNVADDLSELPMRSMIDVVFLLLIYFLVTATLIPSESRLASALKAERQSGGSASDFQTQIINIERAGDRWVYRIGDLVMRDNSELYRVLLQLPTDPGVIVRVHADVPVEAVAAAVQQCKNAQFKKVTYVPAS